MNTLVGVLAATFPVLIAFQDEMGLDQERIPTVAGPEHAELDNRMKGYVVFDRPVGGLVAVSLESSQEVILREPDGGGTVHSVSGPDDQGRIAFVENHMDEERHLLKVIRLDGTLDQTLFEREGDALWSYNGDEIGDYLALAPTGGLVAFVENLEPVGMQAPSARLSRGRLAVWDVDSGREMGTDAQALDGQLDWFPDGKRVVYSDLVLREQGLELMRRHVDSDEAFSKDFAHWDQIPVVFAYDVEKGSAVALHVGMQPAVSGDGRIVFIRGHDVHWRLYSVEDDDSRSFEAPGGIWPGVIGFVEPSLPLYWAWPTEGARRGWTTSNSPLVGPKPMRTLKVMDLATGEFRTVIPSIDPRRTVSFGMGKR